MKSKEYFEKYFDNVSDKNEFDENARSMLRDFSHEFSEIEKVRNPKTVDGVVGIVRELNEKWNSVASKVEKKYSCALLKRNAIWNIMLAEKFGDEFPRKPD